MMRRIRRHASAACALLLAFLALPGHAQELSTEFTRNYRAYNEAFAAGQFDRAAELARTTLDLAIKELGPEHEKTAVLRINLGHVLLLNGRLAESEKELRAARATLEKLHGPDHSDLATIHEDLAGIHAGRGEADPAIAELSAAIAVLGKRLGDGAPEVLGLLIQRGALEAAAKRFDAATATYRAALHASERSFGKDSAPVAVILSLQGDLEAAQNRRAEAEQLYLNSLAMLQKNLVVDDPRIIAVEAKLANFYIGTDDAGYEQHADRVIALIDGGGPQAMPLFVVEPKYPVDAAGRKVLGWVLLEFTVTAAGRVTGPRVLEAQPPGILDQAALAAARLWRFKPKVADGKRRDQPDTRARVVFGPENVDVHLGEMQSPAAAAKPQ